MNVKKSKPCEYPRESVSAAEGGKCQNPHREALSVFEEEPIQKIEEPLWIKRVYDKKSHKE